MSLFSDLGTPMKAAGWANWKLSPRAVTMNIDDVRVTMEPSKDGQGLFIHDFHALNGVGTGAGKKAMRKIIAIADKLGLPIDLDAASYRNEGDMQRLDQEDLVRWYEKFGFAITGEGNYESMPNMRRVPDAVMSSSAESVDALLSPKPKGIPEGQVLVGNRKVRFVSMIKRLSEERPPDEIEGEGWIFDDGERRVSEESHHEVAEIAADNLDLPRVDDAVTSFVHQTGIIRTLFSDNHYFVDIPSSPTKKQVAALTKWISSVEDAVEGADKNLEWTIGNSMSGPSMVQGTGSKALFNQLERRLKGEK